MIAIGVATRGHGGVGRGRSFYSGWDQPWNLRKTVKKCFGEGVDSMFGTESMCQEFFDDVFCLYAFFTRKRLYAFPIQKPWAHHC